MLFYIYIITFDIYIGIFVHFNYSEPEISQSFKKMQFAIFCPNKIMIRIQDTYLQKIVEACYNNY